jgi:hypothetical protein
VADDEQPPYAVGYGRPPTHSRWKKGQSGNPKGRRQGVKNLATAFQDALNERATITENGKRKTVSMRSIITKRMVHKAASGDAKAASIVIAEDRLHNGVSGAGPGPMAEFAEAEFAEAERETLANLIGRIRAGEPLAAESAPAPPEGEASSDEVADIPNEEDRK